MLRHALLSFVFGAVIIGATVNIVAGLLNNCDSRVRYVSLARLQERRRRVGRVFLVLA